MERPGARSDTLDRFVQAQVGTIDAARRELAAGRKTGHWMWFVFPQLRGLGHSPTATFYGLDGLDEAERYAAHPVLGPRLRDCTGLVLQQPQADPHRIFGSPDDLKFGSCLTLFERASPGDAIFGQALERFYRGRRDPSTLALLGGP